MSAAAALEPDKRALLLKNFRERVADVLPAAKNDFHRSDAIVEKFLKVREYNVEQAEEMLRKTIEWRQANNVNAILERPFCHELDPFYSLLHPGFTKKGHPLFIGRVGRWDPNGLLHPMCKTESAKIVTAFLENGLKSCEKMIKDGKMITKGFGIIDCAEFDYTWLTYAEVVSTMLRLVGQNVQIVVNNYPQCVHEIVIVNAPSVFHMIWSVIKPLLPPDSLARIFIYGAYGINEGSWKDYLLERIDPDVLPSQYGGANTTGLLNCRVEVDKEAIPKIGLELLPPGELIEHYLEPGKSFSVDITTNAPGDHIVWNFKTDSYDIGFKVECDDGGVIIEQCRVDAHKFTQKGKLLCPSKAKYTLTWDNSYSYWTGKKLCYAVKVKN